MLMFETENQNRESAFFFFWWWWGGGGILTPCNLRQVTGSLTQILLQVTTPLSVSCMFRLRMCFIIDYPHYQLSTICALSYYDFEACDWNKYSLVFVLRLLLNGLQFRFVSNGTHFLSFFSFFFFFGGGDEGGWNGGATLCTPGFTLRPARCHDNTNRLKNINEASR